MKTDRIAYTLPHLHSQYTNSKHLFLEVARKIIVRHGCTLDENADECMVSFPEGTTRTEILPRMMTERYCITFPDNYELQEVYDKYREISVLLYPRE